MVREQARLQEAHKKQVPWRKWGPYLSERQWGTVREDYSADGNAWDHFSHDQARSRAYHWGEDGLAGICDDQQHLCFALALWNERDPILKERLFGLTNREGNHGEDVKEYYFYLDNTPTHSYMKYLYKYPQAAYPYGDLVRTNRARTPMDREYELLDTGVFENDRYFDVMVEYTKASPEDVLVRITVINHGPEAAALHVLPTLWFRNTWSWGRAAAKPGLRQVPGPPRMAVVQASCPQLGDRYLYAEAPGPLLFTENETNCLRLYGQPNASLFVKDAINACVVGGNRDAVNPQNIGTKVSLHHVVTVPPHASVVLRLRLTTMSPDRLEAGNPETSGTLFGSEFDAIFAARKHEADEFYHSITPRSASQDEAMVLRQALAGMLWGKQFYYFDLDQWLDEHAAHPLHAIAPQSRNSQWFHMVNHDVISIPDKWEYPWYAAWDLAFHTVPLAMVDMDFAKQQLELMLREEYLHPNGQVPAYEWNFSDVNPPVHALAAMTIYDQEVQARGRGDLDFLRRVFTKLLLNFTWWVNRKDRAGRNIFEGGFLGLDNIGIFDRSAPLPTGGYIEQADGTAWMAMFCQTMLEMAVELATHDRSYEDMALKFMEHFFWIAAAMNQLGTDHHGLWDEQDGFYYDVLRMPDGSTKQLKVRSMVGLLPLAATTIIEKSQREKVPCVVARVQQRIEKMPEIRNFIHPTGPGHLGVNERGILALVGPDRLRRILTRMLDENEFLSTFGIRSLSRYHLANPYVLQVGAQEYRVSYLPAESDSTMFGGNSNWRGPIWLPVNLLLIRSLQQFHLYHGNAFQIECPTGSGHLMNLGEVATEIARRIIRIFLRDEHGRRPLYGTTEKFQTDPLWRNQILFYEYFHGDNGAGIGASHQTGWTGVVAKLIQWLGQAGDREHVESAGIARPSRSSAAGRPRAAALEKPPVKRPGRRRAPARAGHKSGPARGRKSS